MSALKIAESSSASPRRSWLSAAPMGVILLCGAYLLARQVTGQNFEWPASPQEKLLVYGGLQLLAWLCWWLARGGRRWLAWLAQAALTVLALLFVAAVVGRLQQRFGFGWPPTSNAYGAAAFGQATAEARAEYAARIVMHRLSVNDVGTPLRIPEVWPFPADAQVAIQRGGNDSVRVWTRVDTVVRCAEYPQDLVAGATMRQEGAQREHQPCHGQTPPGPAAFAEVPRSAEADATPPFDSVVPANRWAQFRGDGARSGRVASDEVVDRAWSAHIDGEVRSSASVIGDLVFVGSHGTGSLAAFDVRTGERRWIRRVPNWIHQDIVGDARVVVVGFGDNLRSLSGRAPAGVAAFDARTGRHRWTAFDESSVMTSPVVIGNRVIYGTSTGEIHERRLSDGALIGTVRLEGGVIMGPPAAVGDTVVFTLDYNRVCAVVAGQLTPRWCRVFPHYALTGHYAPTIVNGHVLVAASVAATGIHLAEFFTVPWSVKWRVLRMLLLSPVMEPIGQRLSSLRLADGSIEWQGELRVTSKPISGHPAGTAVISGTTGVILYPMQDSLVAFDPQNGAVKWSTTASGSRGPPLVVDSTIVHVGRKGDLSVIALTSGKRSCTLPQAGEYDRAGPALAGGRLIIVNTVGTIRALPLADVLACTARD